MQDADLATTALVDGQPQSTGWWQERACQFGDGLFETLAVVDGAPCLWEAHLDRLRRGCRVLGLAIPDPEVLRTDAERLCSGQLRATLKLYWTGGRSLRGYARPGDGAPTRCAVLAPWPEPKTSWRVRLCRHRLSRQPSLAGLKHLNRLDQVIARDEWQDPDIDEGLMLGIDGHLACGTRSNIYLWRNGELFTPSLELEGVRGTVRELVVDAGNRFGHPVRITTLGTEDLASAEAVYLSNALVGIVPVHRIDDRDLPAATAWPPALTEAAARCHQPSWSGSSDA